MINALQWRLWSAETCHRFPFFAVEIRVALGGPCYSKRQKKRKAVTSLRTPKGHRNGKGVGVCAIWGGIWGSKLAGW
jgi:hypothetical protein